MEGLSQSIKAYAQELGFNSAGIVPAEPSPRLNAYLRWISKGMHGTMEYMARPDRISRREAPNRILPGARSLVVVTLDYFTDPPSPAVLDPARGRISNYAWGQDYHRFFKERLNLLAAILRELERGTHAQAFVDTGAFMERTCGERAGFGFVGKNSMLINPGKGSYFFLGEVITTLALDYDPPARRPLVGCGTCARCLTACPTNAFSEPYVLDARRCISYLTIEHVGPIDRLLRPLMGNWVYGCDICQEVCPWQRFAPAATQSEMRPISNNHIAPQLEVLLRLTASEFEQRYSASSIHRIGRNKLVGNACIAAGNSRRPELASALALLLTEDDPVIRNHAVWALGRLSAGKNALEQARRNESDPQVRLEIDDALARQS